MNTQTPIICNTCKKPSGLYEEDLKKKIILENIKCNKCGTILIQKNPILIKKIKK